MHAEGPTTPTSSCFGHEISLKLCEKQQWRHEHLQLKFMCELLNAETNIHRYDTARHQSRRILLFYCFV